MKKFILPLLLLFSNDSKALEKKISPYKSGKNILRFEDNLATITCAPLRLCAIALEPEEVLNSVHIGDSEQWLLKPSHTGSGESKRVVLIIKPTEANIQTSLIVTTDRRTYLLDLLSTHRKYMPYTEFTYSDSDEQKMISFIDKQKKEVEKERKKEPRIRERIFLDYEIDGKASWTPEHIYHDGVKTYIQFPSFVSNRELPILAVVPDNSEEEQLVNYRVLGQTIKVDFLIKRGILVSGIGSEQERIAFSLKE
jgi:type IV secretion system protein TrbG